MKKFYFVKSLDLLLIIIVLASSFQVLKPEHPRASIVPMNMENWTKMELVNCQISFIQKAEVELWMVESEKIAPVILKLLASRKL